MLEPSPLPAQSFPHDARWATARVKRHVQELARLALPIVVSRTGIMMMSLVDTMLVGHYSSTELAYQSIGLSPASTVVVISIGLMMGTMVLVSSAFGAGRLKDCGLVWRRSLRYGLAIGCLGALICAFGEDWLKLFGQSADLARGGGRVLQIFGLGLPAFLIYLTCTYFLEGIGRPLAGMIAMLLANIVNAFLNWVFIFGHFGFAPMGAAGSAWATTLTRIFLAVFIFAYIWNLKDHAAFGIRNKALGHWRDWRRQRHIGYGASVSLGLEVSAFTAMNIFAGWIGTLALGAFSITFSMFAMVFMVASGIGNAAAVRVGIAEGRKDYADLTLAGWTGLGVNTLVMLPFVMLFLMLPFDLAGSYTHDPALILVTAPLVVLAGWMLVLDGGQSVMGSALRGRGETWAPTILYAVAYYGVMIPLAWYLAFPLGRGATGLFEAMILASLVSVTLLAARFQFLSRRDRKRPTAPTQNPGQ